MTGRENSAWQGKVSNLLAQGYGVEDIALRLRCKISDVRQEVEILRGEGKIERIVRREAF